MSLVLGVAGAGAGNGYVLTTGAAGLLAGALSMAAGEYVSVRSQREMYEYQMALEREELAEYPEEEAEELALIYQARGVELEQARAVSRALLAHPAQALDVLAREELGLNPDDLGSPWRAALSSFVTFAVGAAVPLVPFLLHQRGRARHRRGSGADGRGPVRGRSRPVAVHGPGRAAQRAAHDADRRRRRPGVFPRRTRPWRRHRLRRQLS